MLLSIFRLLLSVCVLYCYTTYPSLPTTPCFKTFKVFELHVVNTERRTRLDRTASTNHVFYLWNLFSALFPLPPFFLHHLAPELRLSLAFFSTKNISLNGQGRDITGFTDSLTSCIWLSTRANSGRLGRMRRADQAQATSLHTIDLDTRIVVVFFSLACASLMY